MAGNMASVQVHKVWIAEGCILCNLCEETCPEVFDVREDRCMIRESAVQHYLGQGQKIAQAAEECPVDVIRVLGFNESDEP